MSLHMEILIQYKKGKGLLSYLKEVKIIKKVYLLKSIKDWLKYKNEKLNIFINLHSCLCDLIFQYSPCISHPNQDMYQLNNTFFCHGIALS